MFRDFVSNGEAHGDTGGVIQEVQYDTGLLRPYYDYNGAAVCNIKTGKRIPMKKDGQFVTNTDGTRKMVDEREVVRVKDLMANPETYNPVLNATTLSKDQWIKLDNRVIQVARETLRAWGDLRAANTYGGFDGMTVSVLEHETITDDGEAIVDMDGIEEGRSDQSHYQLEGLPLPITHSSFWYSRRKLMTSRNNGTPISFVRAEQATRRVAETIEKTLIGITPGLLYGDTTQYNLPPQVYGYTNFPDRLTMTTLPAPSTLLTDSKAFVDKIIEMVGQARDANFSGPYVLYVSTTYDNYLDSDYKATEASSTQTIRSRLNEIDGIKSVRRLDFLKTDEVVLVQMTSNVAEAVNGMEIQTTQWEGMGGQKLNFKVMGIQVPSLKSDARGITGIVHGTTS